VSVRPDTQPCGSHLACSKNSELLLFSLPEAESEPSDGYEARCVPPPEYVVVDGFFRFRRALCDTTRFSLFNAFSGARLIGLSVDRRSGI